ncbi:MAG: UTP--glucose-1-phosphate uridylyltransferase GalU [Methylococcaceae bacterium]|nr:UTP--glucose-1-phosphate uridylyltransferase GalU [Methylococcaceae bacterium]
MIKKAVIPAAGLGTRFLPATKAQPKEMLPVVDKPTIQYVVEEAVASGIRDILIVISRGKRAVEEHFDRSFELEVLLERKGRGKELEEIRRIADLADIHFVWQKEQNGLGDAIFQARHHLGDEPFAVLLGDTIVQGHPPITRQLLELHQRFGGIVLALEQASREKLSRYGVMGGEAIEDRVYRIDDLVEKPRPESAPSDLVIAGRYILTPEIFTALERTVPGANGEIQLTDALRALLGRTPLHGLHFEGRRHDIGNKLDFLKTNVLLGLEHPELGPALRHCLQQILKEP